MYDPSFNAVWRVRLGALLVLAVAQSCSVARADGGRLQMSRQAGPWQVSVFTTPTPIRVGTVDVSVLVQDGQTRALVSDAHVTMRAVPQAGHEKRVVAHASHAAATNRLLQAAYLDLPSEGGWGLTVTVESQGQRCELQVPVEVAAAMPPWQAMWPWLTLPVWPIALFALHHLLRARERTHLPIQNP